MSQDGAGGDYVASSGGAALGARLRRLSTAIDADAGRIYAARGIRFEQRWFGVLDQLDRRGPLSVQQLADALGITHASVSETRGSLWRAGYITQTPDPRDARRSLLALSEEGRAVVGALRPVWDAFDEAAKALDAEAGGVVRALTRLEQALAETPLRTRVLAALRR